MTDEVDPIVEGVPDLGGISPKRGAVGGSISVIGEELCGALVGGERQVIPRLWSRWITHRRCNARAGDLEKLIGFELHQSVAYRLGQEHPDLQSAPGVSMLEAFSSFGELLRARYPDIEVVDKPIEQDRLRRHVITFGSPSSNVLSRNMHGFEDVAIGGGEKRHTLKKREGLLFEPPLNFILEDESASIYRGVREDGGNRTEYFEPRWGVIDKGVSKFPKLREIENGKYRLSEDYLIISCFPNITKKEQELEILSNYVSGGLNGGLYDVLNERQRTKIHQKYGGHASVNIRKFVNIAGLHGPGTASVKMLLSSSSHIEAMNRAWRNVGCPQYWQALVRVDVVDWRDGRDVPISVAGTGIVVHKVEIDQNLVRNRIFESLED